MDELSGKGAPVPTAATPAIDPVTLSPDDHRDAQLLVAEIERERTTADRPRRERFDRAFRNPWLTMQDLVGGPASTWPSFIRAAFWSGEHFDDNNRRHVVLFAILNGIHLDTLMQVLRFTIGQRHLNAANREYQVVARYNYLTKAPSSAELAARRQRVWSFSVRDRQIMNLNYQCCDSRGNVRPDPNSAAHELERQRYWQMLRRAAADDDQPSTSSGRK